MIDGANGVCRRPAPRTDTVSASTAAVLGFTLVLATVALALPRARPRFRAGALVGLGVLVVALAVPGLGAVWFRRADSPAHLGDTAAAVQRLVAAVERFAAARGPCVDVVNHCEACEPVLRYARPTARRCAATARVVVDEGALGPTGGCTPRGGDLYCGAQP